MLTPLQTRRGFLRSSVLGAAAAWTLPAFSRRPFFALDAPGADRPARSVSREDGPILIVLHQAGGNDGLHTVVPWADDAYYRARPTLALQADKILRLNDYCGLHPQLGALKSLYDEGHLAVIQGVGYPNPSRSHLRSTEIWHTASDAHQNKPGGWLGTYLAHCCPGAPPAVGVSIGETTPPSFASPSPAGGALANPEPARGSDQGASGAAGFCQGPLHLQPRGGLAGSLRLVARMIAGDLPTRVYCVSHGGYDTHQGQARIHERLMAELGEAIGALTADLKAQGNFERVLLLSFSEFGRRVGENANGGTDHGAAAPMFVIGGGVKPGLFGQSPSLTQLCQGDLIPNVDFRRVYATVLERHLRVPSEPVLGRKFPLLPFV